MENLYTPSALISPEEFWRIGVRLDLSWSLLTAHPGSRAAYTPENKALGQCVPTAIIIQDLFGGKLAYDRVRFHMWNELPDGSQQDFSRSQSLEGTVLHIDAYKDRKELLLQEGHEVSERYALLRRRFLQTAG